MSGQVQVAAATGRSWCQRRWVWPSLIAVTCVVLAVVGWLHMADRLGPSTVYTDDAWVLLGVKGDRLIDIRRAGSTAPGFVVLLRAWLEVVGFSNTRAQLVPVAAAVLAPPVFVLVALRMRLRYPAALLGGAMLLASPTLGLYGPRVKQYTLEVLVAILLVGLGWVLLRRPASGRLWALFGIASVVSIVLSFTLVFLVIAGVTAGLVATWQQDGTRRLRCTPAVWCASALGAFTAVWFLVIIRPLANDALQDFWSSVFLSGSPGDDWTLVRYWFGSAFRGPHLAWIVLFLLSTALVAWRRPLHALLFGVPVVLAVAASAAHAMPFGGGRTDCWLYAPVVFMIASGVDVAIGWLRERSRRVADGGGRSAAGVAPLVASGMTLLVAATLIITVPTPDDFIKPDIVPLLEQMDVGREADDLVITSPGFSFTYPLYENEPFTTRYSDRNTVEFTASPDGVDHLAWEQYDDPYAELQLRAAATDDVWLVDSPGRFGIPYGVRDALAAQGFVMVETVSSFGGVLEHWQRP